MYYLVLAGTSIPQIWTGSPYITTLKPVICSSVPLLCAVASIPSNAWWKLREVLGISTKMASWRVCSHCTDTCNEYICRAARARSCSCKSEILSIDILCILCLWQLVIVIALLFVAVRGLLDQIQLLSKVTSCWFCSSTSRTNVSTAGETWDSSYSRYWNRWTHTHLPLRINSPSASCRVSTLWQLEIFASHRNSPQQHSFFENWSAFTTIVGCASGEALSRHWPACTVMRWRQTHRELKVSQYISMHLNVSHNFVMRPDYLTIPSLYSTTVLAFVAAIQPLPNFTLWVADAL